MTLIAIGIGFAGLLIGLGLQFMGSNIGDGLSDIGRALNREPNVKVHWNPTVTLTGPDAARLYDAMQNEARRRARPARRADTLTTTAPAGREET